MSSRKQQLLSDYLDIVHGFGESIEPGPDDYVTRLQKAQSNLGTRIEEIRKTVWKRPYPIIFDSDLVSQDTNPESEFHTKETASLRKVLFDKLLSLRKIKLSDNGPRIGRVDNKLTVIGLKTQMYG